MHMKGHLYGRTYRRRKYSYTEVVFVTAYVAKTGVSLHMYCTWQSNDHSKHALTTKKISVSLRKLIVQYLIRVFLSQSIWLVLGDYTEIS